MRSSPNSVCAPTSLSWGGLFIARAASTSGGSGARGDASFAPFPSTAGASCPGW